MSLTWRLGLAQDPRRHDDACDCERCEMVFHIVRYMLFYMEPTDRAVRLPDPVD